MICYYHQEKENQLFRITKEKYYYYYIYNDGLKEYSGFIGGLEHCFIPLTMTILLSRKAYNIKCNYKYILDFLKINLDKLN